MKTAGRLGNKKILVAGCGYIGQRLCKRLPEGKRVTGLVRSGQSRQILEKQSIGAVCCDLSAKVDMELPTGGADVYYLLPPPKTGTVDGYMANFIDSFAANGCPERILYISTTGVYGDCQGRWIDENQPPNPQADRARRRYDAEQQLMDWAGVNHKEVVIIRVAGIYGPGKLPLARLRAKKPMIAADQAPWTNRIHADDLVQVCLQAMNFGKSGEIYNVTDGQPGNMADYFNQVADMAGLPRPPVISLEKAEEQLSAGLQSYLAESRRIDNRKMLEELQLELRYPNLEEGLKVCFSD
jgi:nucleoside-diphosphate-sugar epimerase